MKIQQQEAAATAHVCAFNSHTATVYSLVEPRESASPAKNPASQAELEEVKGADALPAKKSAPPSILKMPASRALAGEEIPAAEASRSSRSDAASSAAATESSS